MFLGVKESADLANNGVSTSSFACRTLNSLIIGKVTSTADSMEDVFISVTSNGNTIVNEVPFGGFMAITNSTGTDASNLGISIPFGGLPVNGTCEISVTNSSGAVLEGLSIMAVIDIPARGYFVYSKYQTNTFSGNAVSKVIFCGFTTNTIENNNMVTVQVGKRSSAITYDQGSALLKSISDGGVASSSLLYAGPPSKLALNGATLGAKDFYLVQSSYKK